MTPIKVFEKYDSKRKYLTKYGSKVYTFNVLKIRNFKQSSIMAE